MTCPYFIKQNKDVTQVTYEYDVEGRVVLEETVVVHDRYLGECSAACGCYDSRTASCKYVGAVN